MITLIWAYAIPTAHSICFVNPIPTGGFSSGNIPEERIEQVGELLKRFQQDYRVIENFQELKILTG
jgi:hypothetical protein